MNKELQSLIDKYCDAFLSQDIVKLYFSLEKTINESNKIKLKQDKLRKCQKHLAMSINDEAEHKKALQDYESAKNDLENDPLINNYRILQEEILYKINCLKDKLDSN